jgi:universal stress protein A
MLQKAEAKRTAAFAIYRLSFATCRISRNKNCTRISNRGAAKNNASRQSHGMKTLDTLPWPSTAAIALKRILVPVDFSPLSKKALQYAMRLAQEFYAEVKLLHVVEPEVPPEFDGFMIAPPVILNGSNVSYARRLKRFASSARTSISTQVDCAVATGLPAHEIVEAAKTSDVDLIVIATHGYTGWKHFAIGSTAERVVRAAPCPVLVVREKEHDFI